MACLVSPASQRPPHPPTPPPPHSAICHHVQNVVGLIGGKEVCAEQKEVRFTQRPWIRRERGLSSHSWVQTGLMSSRLHFPCHENWEQKEWKLREIWLPIFIIPGVAVVPFRGWTHQSACARGPCRMCWSGSRISIPATWARSRGRLLNTPYQVASRAWGRDITFLMLLGFWVCLCLSCRGRCGAQWVQLALQAG